MIRINLLPIKEKRRRATGQRHLFVILVLVGLECLGFFYIYSGKADELKERKAVVTDKKKQIADLKREVGDIEKLQKEKADLEQQQGVLDRLEAGRAGPVNVLSDLAFMLTPPEDAQAKLELERRGGNPNFDSRRVWLLSFIEQDREVMMVGEAKSNDDVAEFLARLQESRYFRDVKLLWTKLQERADLGGVRFVRFNLRCKVAYDGKTSAPALDLSGGGKKKKGKKK